jgi:hypothetical protein
VLGIKTVLYYIYLLTKRSTFRALADDRSGALPYDADLADQRARYGDGLLRKAPEQLSRQESYEGEARERVEEARRARAEEQARIQAAEVRLLPKPSPRLLESFLEELHGRDT